AYLQPRPGPVLLRFMDDQQELEQGVAQLLVPSVLERDRSTVADGQLRAMGQRDLAQRFDAAVSGCAFDQRANRLPDASRQLQLGGGGRGGAGPEGAVLEEPVARRRWKDQPVGSVFNIERVDESLHA